MAPIQGHLMVPKAMRILKFAVSQAKALLRTKAPSAPQTNTSLNSIRTYTQKTIAIHPTALLKQSKPSHPQTQGSRPYSSTPKPTGKASGPRYNRSSFPISRTSRAIAEKGTAPFASTLRPNLTGGTLPRSAGGYTLGGAGRARQFSHTSGCQAQVVQNVSAGIRAFFVSGSKARFDGVDPVTGEKRWKAVTETQNTVYQKWETAANAAHCPKGTFLEFQLSPTITALFTLKSSKAGSHASFDMSAAKETTLNSPDVLHTLSSDFARAFRDLALITQDLNKLSAFGDLPLSLIQTSRGLLLQVRFPGCDADAVSALCDEVDIRRGVIVEDEAWADSRDAEMALLFPFAPAEQCEELDVSGFFGKQHPLLQRETVEWRDMPRSLSRGASSEGEEREISTLHYDLPTLSLPEEGYESLSDIYYPNSLHSSPHPPTLTQRVAASAASSKAPAAAAAEAEYEGVEGIYRFLQEIDDARRR